MTELHFHRDSTHLSSAPVYAADRTVLRVDHLPFTRTLVFAPHPDDESIGCGALIAEIASRGGDVRVVFMTDGDNNPWPQRAARRQWKLREDDRERWGRLRRAEARRALSQLGVAPCNASFLGLPDDRLAKTERASIVGAVAPILSDVRPTMLVVPSLHDFHPDHRVTHRAVLTALQERPVILSYIVHGNTTPACRELEVDEDASRRKRAAVGCHRSQLLLSRRRFTGYANRRERFAIVHDIEPVEETRTAALVAKARHALSLVW